MNEKKKEVKQEKGAIVVMVVVTILMFALILMGAYISITTLKETQLKSDIRIQQLYGADVENVEQIYKENMRFDSLKGVNMPQLDEENGMVLVTFNETSKTWVEDSTKSDYDYIAGTGTADNTASKWANAKVTVDGIDSYFVWIPRYAYKIDSANQTIDVKFIKGTGTIAADGTVCKYADDSSLTEEDYIIHPAFTSNVDLGGGFGELAGLWIGKYETSRADSTATSTGSSTTLKVVPNVISWRSTKIGDMYIYAKAYNENLKSHMLKNSEWGAVAYLTHSQYGRNGNEIAVNQCESFITGAGKSEGTGVVYESSTYVYDESTFETTYSYTTELGQKTSTTGNVYGIYDISGGAWEHVAAYYNGSSSLSYGSSFATSGGTSDKYCTVYIGIVEDSNYIKGDATYETSGWNSDYAKFMTDEYPFLKRGGSYVNTDVSGSFLYNCVTGIQNGWGSFRVSLCVR